MPHGTQRVAEKRLERILGHAVTRRSLRGIREVIAIGLGAFVAAILWLVLVEGVLPGPETTEFNHPLGEMIRGVPDDEATSDSALGVVGDPVGPTGLWATVGIFAALLVIQRVVFEPFMKARNLFVRPIPLAVLAYVLWGVLFTTLADDRVGLGAGLFGVDDGAATVITYAIASYLCALGGTRIIELVRTVAWWTPRGQDMSQLQSQEEREMFEREGLVAPGALPTRGRAPGDGP